MLYGICCVHSVRNRYTNPFQLARARMCIMNGMHNIHNALRGDGGDTAHAGAVAEINVCVRTCVCGGSSSSSKQKSVEMLVELKHFGENKFE